VLARPFYQGDAQDLLDSFARWVQFPPCQLEVDDVTGVSTPTTPGLPVEMVLYFAQDITIDSDILALVEPFLTDDGAAWRKCFTTISLLGANLTDGQNQYHARQDEASWNLGPNMQFYRFLEHTTITAAVGGNVAPDLFQPTPDTSSETTPEVATTDGFGGRHGREIFSSTSARPSSIFYYMEGDSIPVQADWLDSLTAEIAASRPFSVLGGRYDGHNWNAYPIDSDIIKPALRYHLNGNSVYDASHPVIQTVLARFDGSDNNVWETEHHSSFDVFIAEMLIEEMLVPVTALALVAEYKTSAFMTNFATTLTLPQDIASTATIVHGAVYVHNWPTPSCPLYQSATDLDWFPNNAANTISETKDWTMTLVVSDFGDGSIHTFMASIAAAREYLKTKRLNGACNEDGGDPLPFQTIVVLTHDQTFADEYAALYPDAQFVARDWSLGTARWDMCEAVVATTWFMLVTSRFTVAENFKLPVDVDAITGKVIPLMPFIDHDSPYCRRECRTQIDNARLISPRFNRNYGQEFAIFKQDIVSEYCNHLQDGTTAAGVARAEPSINGYFAFIQFVDDLAAPEATVLICEGVAEAARCSANAVREACSRDDIVGDDVRESCKATCGTCIAGNDATPIDWTDDRESKATYEWWERKHSIGLGAKMYKGYDKLRLFALDGFKGEPEPVEKCEDAVDTTDCPCIFPFFHNGAKHSGCTVWGDEGHLRCPTSLTNLQEIAGDSDDWKYCTESDFFLTVDCATFPKKGACIANAECRWFGREERCIPRVRLARRDLLRPANGNEARPRPRRTNVTDALETSDDESGFAVQTTAAGSTTSGAVATTPDTTTPVVFKTPATITAALAVGSLTVVVPLDVDVANLAAADVTAVKDATLKATIDGAGGNFQSDDVERVELEQGGSIFRREIPSMIQMANPILSEMMMKKRLAQRMLVQEHPPITVHIIFKIDANVDLAMVAATVNEAIVDGAFKVIVVIAGDVLEATVSEAAVALVTTTSTTSMTQTTKTTTSAATYRCGQPDPTECSEKNLGSLCLIFLDVAVKCPQTCGTPCPTTTITATTATTVTTTTTPTATTTTRSTTTPIEECSAQSARANCNRRANCKWKGNKKNGQCNQVTTTTTTTLGGCAGFDKRNDCTRVAVCRWKGKTDVCVDRNVNVDSPQSSVDDVAAVCTLLAYKRACNTVGECRWSGRKQVCVVRPTTTTSTAATAATTNGAAPTTDNFPGYAVGTTTDGISTLITPTSTSRTSMTTAFECKDHYQDTARTAGGCEGLLHLCTIFPKVATSCPLTCGLCTTTLTTTTSTATATTLTPTTITSATSTTTTTTTPTFTSTTTTTPPCDDLAAANDVNFCTDALTFGLCGFFEVECRLTCGVCTSTSSTTITSHTNTTMTATTATTTTATHTFITHTPASSCLLNTKKSICLNNDECKWNRKDEVCIARAPIPPTPKTALPGSADSTDGGGAFQTDAPGSTIAAVCTDPGSCDGLPASKCFHASVRSLCTNLCNLPCPPTAPTTTTTAAAPPTTVGWCTTVSPSKCAFSSVREVCPNLCNTGSSCTDDSTCGTLSPANCADQADLQARCPHLCNVPCPQLSTIVAAATTTSPTTASQKVLDCSAPKRKGACLAIVGCRWVGKTNTCIPRTT
jgi:hypothetical protein